MEGDGTALEAILDSVVAGYWGQQERGAGATVPCRVVRNGDVGKDGRIEVEDLPVRWFNTREVTKARIRDGDAVLVSSGAYTGNVGRVGAAASTEPIIVSNFVRRLRHRDGIDKAWLFHLLRSSVVQRSVWPHTGGSAIPTEVLALAHSNTST